MKKNLLSLLILLLSAVCSGNYLSAQEIDSKGTWGGIDWTLTTDGTLTIAPTVNEITKVKPYSKTNPKELYQVGEWPAAVNDAITAITGWPYNRSKVKKLIIEEGVTSIGSFTAQGFTNLTGEVVIPSTVTYIGQEAFQKSKMTKLTFAKGGTKSLCMGPGAFKSLNITELELPGDRPEVHVHCWAFNGCSNLENVTIPANVIFGGWTHAEYEGMDYVYGSYASSSDIFNSCPNIKNINFLSEDVYNKFMAAQGNKATIMNLKNAKVEVTDMEVVAMIGNIPYSSLQGAINGAANGNEIVVVKDVTLDVDDKNILASSYNTFLLVENKTISIDLNGKTIIGDVTGVGIKGVGLVGLFSINGTGHLTLNDKVGGAVVKIENATSTDPVYALFSSFDGEKGSALTINGGSYSLNAAQNALIHSAPSEKVVINDGTFYLGNVGTGSNGSPWIFNANGNNQGNIIVNGGTYNYDILHQHWIFEVKAPKERALRNNGDGTYTMVDAVAWINEKHSDYIKEVGYTTLEEAFVAAHEYNTYKNVVYTCTVNVIANSTVQSPINVTENVNLNLGGNHNVTASLDKMISIKNGAKMNVNGSGRLTNNGGNVFFVENGNLTINDGNFAGNGNIIDCDNNNYNTTAKATIYYGRFFNWDPEDNTAEGEGTNFCADGHISIDNHDGSYSVIHGDNIAYLVGKARYNSLQEAIDNAVNNDVIMVLQDFTTSSGDLLELDTNLDTYFMIADKTVTIDLNGKRIYSEYAAEEGRKLAGVFSTKGTGNLTINNSNEEYESVVEAKANSTIYALIVNYDETSATTINGGKYILDNAQDCLVFSDGNGTTINGGYYTLGNANEKPIFNTIGENQYILVNDGTFNANILNQEVNIPLTKFLQNNNNGTWTIIDAIAWVNENTRENVYASLNDAYAQAQDGDVITLINNTEENGIELNKNVTINFDGKSCSFTNNKGLEISAGKNVTLTGGTLIAKNADYVISTSGNLTINNMTIDGTVEYFGGEMFTDKSFNIAPKKYFKGVGTGHTQNWSTISTPIAGAKFSEPEENEGIHDLYRFNEADELWEYYKDDGNSENGVASNPFDELELGRGYLYANSHDIIFRLGEGSLNIGSVVFPLSYTSGNSLAGFNMIGNPFTHTISESNLSTSATLADGFYVVGANGSWTAKADGKIAPMESVLIQANGKGTLTMSPANTGSKRAARNENSYLTINVASKTHSDVAYVSFNDGMGLDKINHRNPDNPMLYIPVEGKNYAIAMMNQDVKEVPVYFNANRMAEYTISIEQNNCEFNTMTLVDKLTGIETNMLIEDYTFMARTFDDANRFVIRMSIEDNDDSETENFAYVSNGSIVIEKIEGNANIRIFDIMGRHIMGTNATGNVNIPVETMSTGMYIIQMADDNGVKVQKIIIE